MRLIWIRHGETDANREKRYVGHLNPPLNHEGIKQVELLREQLACEKPVKLYASDLARTVETAERIGAAWSLLPTMVEALREISFGDWEGKTYSEIMADNYELATRWFDDPFDLAPPNGETLRQLGTRIDQWLTDLMCVAELDSTIVIVTHGGVIRWIQSKWLQGDSAGYWQSEGLMPGQAMVTCWNGQEWTYCTLAEKERT